MIRPDEVRRERAVRKLTLLDFFLYLNFLKVHIYILQAQTSRQRDQQQWLAWVRDIWPHLPCSSTEAFTRPHAIYQCIIPWSRLEYIGETILSLPEGVLTH